MQQSPLAVAQEIHGAGPPQRNENQRDTVFIENKTSSRGHRFIHGIEAHLVDATNAHSVFSPHLACHLHNSGTTQAEANFRKNDPKGLQRLLNVLASTSSDLTKTSR